MSGSGGVSIARSRGGESRFYNPPSMRKQQQLQQQQQQQQMTTTTMQRREQRPPLISKGSTEKRTDHEDCATLLSSSSSSSSSANNSSKTNDDNSTNLDRFLEFTTPVVSAQYLPNTSMRGCRGQECGLECPPYFEMVDAIAKYEGISIDNVNFKALLGRGFIGNVPVMLAKPHTFMNSSGESVGSIVSYYKIPLKQVLVVYDDLDLPFAKLRLLPKGGHGGHNGMRSIIDRLKGSRDFPRLRIGIGRPPGKMDAVNFVLRPFNKQEREELEFTFEHGIEAVRILLLEGFDKSATFVNSTKAMEQLG